MSHQHPTSTEEQQQEAIPSYPFPFAEHSLECPAMYDQLRATCPVARVHMPFGGDAYLLTRHEDVVKAWTDPKCGVIRASDGDVPRREANQPRGAEEGMVSIIAMPDARHHQTRRLITQAFTVKAANDLAPRVEEVTNTLIDAMERKGPPADLFEDYAIQTPMTVICEMLGVPRDDELLFRQWGQVIVSQTMTPEERQAGWKQITAYLLPLAEQERQHPGKTVLGTLVKAYEQGEEVISQQEMLAFAAALIGAGFETVSTTFTNSAFLLLQRPDLIAQLRERLDDPERLGRAIEEILRTTPIGLGRPRIARDEVTLSGTTIQPGEVMMLDILAANRDEAVFSHAKEVDFEREYNPIVTFGRGIHACLGQQIARMELRVLWKTLLQRLPTIRLAVAPEEVPWRPNDTATFGPAHLPVTWE